MVLAALKERLGEAGCEVKKEPGTEMVANSVVLGLLGLGSDARTEDVTSRIMELKAGGSTDMEAVKELRLKLEEREADEAVMAALKAGKITADQKEWAKDYAKKDRAGFDSFVLKAPVVVPMGKLDSTETGTKDRKAEVNEMVLKACGVSREDIEKYADKEDE